MSEKMNIHEIDGYLALLLLVPFLFIGLIPTIAARKRWHHNTLAIAVLNIAALVAGFYAWQVGLLLWGAALVWACTAVKSVLRITEETNEAQ
jgi:hypothetical protein